MSEAAPIGPRVLPAGHRARLYRTVRSAHLERARELPPAIILYRTRRYDFHDDLAKGLDLIQSGPVRAAVLLARSRVTLLEINEPLMISSAMSSALAIVGLRAGAWLHGRNTTVVAYAIENADPMRIPAPGMRAGLRRALDLHLARFVWCQLDRIAYGTHAARDLYRQVLPVPQRGTAEALVPALPAPCGCTHPEERDAPRATFLGALTDRKGFRLVLEAWPLVRAALPSARLTILGKGALEQLAADAAAADNTIELVIDPSRDEIHRQLRRSGVLTLPSQPTPSWREQVGLPIVEGLAHGCHVVTTSETGLARWLREHGHDVIAPGDGASELAAALVSALRQQRTSSDVSAALPAVDGRLAADAWMAAGGRPGGDADATRG